KKSDFDLEKRFLKIRDGKAPNKLRYGYGNDRMVALPHHLITPLRMWFDILENSEYLKRTQKTTLAKWEQKYEN
ncbi:MAG: hypothetical protein IH949_11825, partial [Bacteroidetes bacterium]|nr:hypothetical protein [Bacteroidota bacterium]